mmetsp:Transcript_7616/g.12845  ORF Transcript_7616/g.12845 Transcript_7616/m.12845 type:complete len:170 (-) Transcript_7616:293-802(-)
MDSFWRQLTALGNTLFEEHSYRSAFLLLGAVCKQCWHTVRTKPTSSAGSGSGGSGRSSSSDSGGRKDESRGGWPTDAVHFTGWVQEKQLPSYLAGIDIVVNPTLRAWSETFCITNTQVMSMGIPLVTFAVGGIGEYVSAPAPPPPSAAAPPPPQTQPTAAATTGEWSQH